MSLLAYQKNFKMLNSRNETTLSGAQETVKMNYTTYQWNADAVAMVTGVMVSPTSSSFIFTYWPYLQVEIQ